MKFLPAFIKSLTNCEIPSTNPFQRACSGDKHKVANISANFCKNLKQSQLDTRVPREN